MSTVETHKAGNVSRIVNRLSQDQDQNLLSALSVRKGGSAYNKKPKFCKARFSYTAEQLDELTFDEGIVIEALEDVEDGWMRGKIWNNKKSGLFPTNFVAFLTDEEVENELGIKPTPALPPTVVSSTTTPAAASKPLMEEKKGKHDFLLQDRIKEKKVDQMPAKKEPVPAKKEPLIATSRRAPSTSAAASGDILDNSFDHKNKEKPEKALVLYSYDAVQVDELDLIENTIVSILDKHCQDDGWYLGEYQGKRGVFPSNFVHIMDKPLNSTAPPTPPPVKPPKPLMSSNKEFQKANLSTTSTDTSIEVCDLPTKSTNAASEAFASKHSAFEPSSKPSQAETKTIGFGPSMTSSTNNAAVANASTKIKNLQQTLFNNRQPPKPGDKPVRPVTTIIDNYTGPESDAETHNEKGASDDKMVHLQRDRPKQANKRPPSMMPVVTSSDSTNSLTNGIANGSATTSFPVKESLPVATQKPAVITTNKKVDGTKEPKTAYKVTHTETILLPSKKAAATGSDTAVPSSSSHTYSPMPIVSEDEPYSAKRYNQMARTFNEMLKDFNNLKQDLINVKQEVQQLRNQSLC
uniref:SH3 domain-containing protein n=1 Tax=Panagrolaimus sp. ES5 TaxID=591445 RepID=A0AC34FKK3_9BILA